MAPKLRLQDPGAVHHVMNRRDRREGTVAKVERLVRGRIAKQGWTETDLARRRQGDREKPALAVGLRSRTTMTLAGMAARLRMGTGASLSNLLPVRRRSDP